MRPTLQAGDLVVLREQPAYSPGDVVAFESSMADAVVMHRIVAIDGDRVTLRGDANDFTDLDRPTTGELLGGRVATVPAVGAAVRLARPAWVRAAIAVGAAALVASAVVANGAPADPRHHSGGRRRTRTCAGGPPAQGTAPMTASGSWRWWSVAAVASVGVLVALWLVPTSGPVTEFRPVTLTSSFTYQAAVPPSAVYASGMVDTGDPVVTAEVGTVDVSVDLTAASDGDRGGSDGSNDVWEALGDVRLSVVVASSAGWSRQIASAGVNRTGGAVNGGVSASSAGEGVVPVDFAAARLLADGFATAMAATGQVTVSVIVGASGLDDMAPVPSVGPDAAPGPVAGLPTVTPGELAVLTFSLTEGAAIPQMGGSGGPSGGGDNANPGPNGDGNLVAEGVVMVPEVVNPPATLGVGSWSVPAAPVAVLATLAALGAAAMAVGLAASSRGRRRAEEAGDLPWRLRRDMVEVAALPVGVESTAVDVADLAGLCAVAKAANQFVLVRDTGAELSFWVIDGPVAYRHRSLPPP